MIDWLLGSCVVAAGGGLVGMARFPVRLNRLKGSARGATH